MGLILIHGSNLSASCWSVVQQHLTKPALAVNLPGRPANPKPFMEVSIDHWCASIVADMNAAELDRVTLVGHSLGGMVACRLAALYPDRVQRLIFLAAVLPLPGQRLLDAMPEAAQVICKQLQADGVTHFEVPPELAQAACADMSAEDLAEALPRLVPESLQPVFEVLHALKFSGALPSVYIRCTRDGLYPLEMQDSYIKHAAACSVVSIDAGHFSMLSQPELVAEMLNKIIKN